MYKAFCGETEGKGPLGRPGRRWEDNLIWAFKKENPGQHRKNGRAVLTTVMITRISYNTGKSLIRCGNISFSRRSLLHAFS